MTVAEMIEKLRQCSPDDRVLMSKDPEGNDGYYVDEVSLHEMGVCLWPGERLDWF